MTEPLPLVSVLLVDDRPENLLALEAVLDGLGYKLVRARSSEEAVSAVVREQFAVILMDIQMPGRDGFETTALLKQLEHGRDIPLIFISAYPERQHVYKSYSAGAVDYISKPVDPDALRSKVAVFVKLRQQQIALELAHAELENRVASRTLELARANAALQREIVERKAAEQRLYDRAFRDDLTALANRALFLIHLNRAVARSRRAGETFAVLVIDIDRFKAVNDGMGHNAGDKLLVAFARRLQDSLREVDTVARFGGDEFAVLLDGVSDITHATRLSERVEHELRGPYLIDGKEVSASASIGIAMMSSRYQRAGELIRDADKAMYRAKASGRSRCHVFDLDLHASVMAHLRLESEVRRAVEKNEMLVHYLPVLDLATGRLRGFDAVTRWMHPERGILGPSNFLSAADATGTSQTIGTQMLEAAANSVTRWRRAGLGDLVVHLPMTGHALARDAVDSTIERTLLRSGTEPSWLGIDVSEHTISTGGERAREALQRLSSIGVPIGIDEYGTGPLTLTDLVALPLSTLKLHPSLLDHLEAGASFVEAVIGLAHTLKKTVLATGVASPDQLAILRKLGCDHVSGGVVSPALDAGAAEAFAAARRQ